MDIFLREDVEDISMEFNFKTIERIDDATQTFIITIPKRENNGTCKFNIKNDSFSFIIKKEDDDVFSFNIAENGYYIENSNLRSLFENKKFTKEELISFMTEFPSIDKELTEKSLDYKEFFKRFQNENLQVIGINQSFYSNNERVHDEYSKRIRPIDIVYLKDDNDKFYRIELTETYGETNDAWRANRFAYIRIEEVENIPNEFNFIPKEMLYVKNQTPQDLIEAANVFSEENDETRSIDISAYIENEEIINNGNLIMDASDLPRYILKLEYEGGKVLNFLEHFKDFNYDESWETSRITLLEDEFYKYFETNLEPNREEVVVLEEISPKNDLYI